MKYKNYILLSILTFMLVLNVNAQSRKDRMEIYNSLYSYEIQCMGVGNDGTKLVKVWSYGKNVNKAVYKTKRDAIAAAIFKGLPAGNGAAKTPAIVTDINAHITHKEFFNEFFKAGGKYLDFINASNENKPKGKDRIKMKGGYKVGMLISINFDELRKYLEIKGIAKRLDSGF